MNCQTLQRQILASEDPARLPPEVEQHLARCASCRAVQQSLLWIESTLPTLPVPPSAGPGAILDKILRGQERRRPPTPPVRQASRPVRLREAGRRKLALAFALAASLLVLAIGLWSWPHQQSNPAFSHLTRYQVQRDQRLLAARTPRQRVETLADYADELFRQVRGTQNALRMDELAQVYVQLVSADLIAQATQLPEEDRAAVLNAIAGRLRQNESEASRLAVEQPGPRARSLQLIAVTARSGDIRLRAMVSTIRS